MKKYISKILFIPVLGLFLSSCNFLDVEDYFEDTLSYDSIFVNPINFERYFWTTPTYFPNASGIYGDNYPGGSATDEMFLPFDHDEYMGVRMVLGRVNPDQLERLNTWAQLYRVVRRVNLILSKIDEVPNLESADKQVFRGYAYFMRGWAYYNLLQNFGPLLIVNEDAIESNREPEYYDKARSTYDESIDYICEQFEQAGRFMPQTVLINQFGRPTRGAAYALIARLRLQAASPLYNGGQAARTYFGDWKRKVDNINYVSQEYDPQKWALAAHAAKRVIDMGIYELYTVEKSKDTPPLPSTVPSADFPNGAGNIDPFHSYKDIFDGEAVPYKNKEIIWGQWSQYLAEYTRQVFPTQQYGGWNGISVSQFMVDAYYMADGADIQNSSAEYPYSESGFLTGIRNFSGYKLGGGQYPIYNMYVNREMRFYASIGFTGRFWPMSSTSENGRFNAYVSYAFDGNAGKTKTGDDARNYPITGYVPVKYVHPDDAWAGTGSAVLAKSFPIIRYAETLLTYAEALNNISGSQTITTSDGSQQTFTRDINELAKYFNQVRFRAGLPGISEAALADVVQTQRVIERERQIEFFNENVRFYDVRRWGIYTETDRPEKWAYGMNTEAPLNNGYFQRTPINHQFIRERITDKKMVWVPIPLGELRKVPSMDQNPGW